MIAIAGISGDCDPRFAELAKAFADNINSRTEVGAALAVTLDGVPVVDLWGGFMDAQRQRPWQRDTLVNAYSITKALVSLSAVMLAEQGRLDLEGPVAELWPEFAVRGKSNIRVSELLSHRAGLPALRIQLPVDSHLDHYVMAAALASERPWWTPGEDFGYHILSFGWLMGEVIRRCSGQTVGGFIRDSIAGPLGVEFHLGTAAAYDERIADIVTEGLAVSRWLLLRWALSPQHMPMRLKALGNPLQKSDVNTRAWRAAEIPASNGTSNARALARLFGVLACDGESDAGRLVGAAMLRRATVERSGGRDRVMKMPLRFGLGFMLGVPGMPGVASTAFGHTGASGSIGFADPHHRVGFAYTVNRTHVTSQPLSAAARRLVTVLYSKLAS